MAGWSSRSSTSRPSRGRPVGHPTRGRRRRIARRGLITGALVAFLVGTLPAWAGETDTFRFEPTPLEVDGEIRRTFDAAIPPGTAVRDAVALTNKTDETRTFRVFAADAREDPDTGRTGVASFGAEPTGVGAWISMDGGNSREVTLPGQQRLEIPFEIARPADATVGGLGALVAEEVAQGEGSGIEVSFRVAILVDARGDPGSEPGLRISELELHAPLQLLPRNATIRASVRNETSRPTSVEVVFTVEALLGSTWELPAGSFDLEPGQAASIETPWVTVPETGALVEVSADATWRGGTIVERTGRTVIMPLWLPLGLILLTGWLLVREVRRREQEPLTETSEAAPST
ncbi:MAG: DUF916 domain-containing protein [Actinobacteria bacterium]|nr:DUF916 domain-containing protein [Actinomycetota bacterium]